MYDVYNIHNNMHEYGLCAQYNTYIIYVCSHHVGPIVIAIRYASPFQSHERWNIILLVVYQQHNNMIILYVIIKPSDYDKCIQVP